MHLNRKNRFVREVCGCIQGTVPMAQCVETLRISMRRYNISLFAPQLELDSGGMSVDVRGPMMREMGEDPAIWASEVDGNYYRFLDDTELILQSLRFSDDYDVVSNQLIIRATARAWGEIYARWANSRRWGGRSDWIYKDFYSGDICEGYWDWAEMAFRIVQAL